MGWDRLLASGAIDVATHAFVKSLGFDTPAPVQVAVLEANCRLKELKSDLVVEAATGSGKTIAFLIPIVEQLLTWLEFKLDPLGDRDQKVAAAKAAGYSLSDEEDLGVPPELVEICYGPTASFRIGAIIMAPEALLVEQISFTLKAYLEFLVEFYTANENPKRPRVTRAIGLLRSFHINSLTGIDEMVQLLASTKSNLACQIVVTTPERFTAVMDEKKSFFSFTNPRDIDLTVMQIACFDEADRIIGKKASWMGLSRILHRFARGRRTMLFSATCPRDVKEAVHMGAKRPVFIRVTLNTGIGNTSSQSTVSHAIPASLSSYALALHEPMHPVFLLSFIRWLATKAAKGPIKAMVFCLSNGIVKHLVGLVEYFIKKFNLTLGRGDFFITEVRGKCRKEDNDKRLRQFREARSGIVFCTEILGRGMDMNVDWVLSYYQSQRYKQEVHRAGRTARAGNPGNHLVLTVPRDIEDLLEIQKQQGFDTKLFDSSGKRFSYKVKAYRQIISCAKDLERNIDETLEAVRSDVDEDEDSDDTRSFRYEHVQLIKEHLKDSFVYPQEQKVIMQGGLEPPEDDQDLSGFDEDFNHESQIPGLKEAEVEIAKASLNYPDLAEAREVMDAKVAIDLHEPARKVVAIQRFLSGTRREFFMSSVNAYLDHVNALTLSDFVETYGNPKHTMPIGMVLNQYGAVKFVRMKETKGTPLTLDFVGWKPPSGDYLDIDYRHYGKQKNFAREREANKSEIAEKRAENMKRKAKNDKLNREMDNGKLIANRKRGERSRNVFLSKAEEEKEIRHDAGLVKRERKGKNLGRDVVSEILKKRPRDAEKSGGEPKTAKKRYI